MDQARSVTAVFSKSVILATALDTDPGWTTSGQWAFGVPQGAGGDNGNDPAAGVTGPNVYGYILAGDY